MDREVSAVKLCALHGIVSLMNFAFANDIAILQKSYFLSAIQPPLFLSLNPA